MKHGSDGVVGGLGKDRTTTAGKAKEFVDRTLRCRYEMKYVIGEAMAEVIRELIRPYIQPDRYSKLQRGGWYPIVSLYLDSPDLRLCRESLTGQKNRFKLRVRSYTDEPDYPRFFEIKRRINTVIVKSRARVMSRDVPAILVGRRVGPQSYTTDVDVFNQFQFYINTIQARPAVLVRYMRQAFEGDSENRVRITFDRELCYCVTDKPEVRLGGGGWQRSSITTTCIILEIKFTGCYPPWLRRTVEYLNLAQCSISKYATSIQQACALGFCGPTLRDLRYG